MIDNPFQINDWTKIKFLIFVLSIQIAEIVLNTLQIFGLKIPLVTEFVGLIYLLLVPGIILLRIFNIHNVGSVKAFIFSVGISLLFNIFLGTIINFIYPLLGIEAPLSNISIILTWGSILLLLAIVAYFRPGSYIQTPRLDLDNLSWVTILSMLFLPASAILGTTLVNSYENNILLIILLIIVAVVPFILIVTKRIPEYLYPFTIFCIALSLIWSLNLISPFIVQWDSFLEYHYAELVIQKGFWDWQMSHVYNALPSITVLPGVMSPLSGFSATWLFKFVYPVILALIPVGLYEVYRNMLTAKKAFLASFLVIANYNFFLELPAINRQIIAEYFCLMIIMLIVDGKKSPIKSMLFLLSIIGLVVSHYSLSYIYILFFIIAYVILKIIKKGMSQITVYSVLFLSIVCIAWYLFTTGGSPLVNLLNIGQKIYTNFNFDFLNPFSRDIGYILFESTNDPLLITFKILWYVMMLFIFIGIIRVLNDIIYKKSNQEYSALAIGNYILFGLCMAIPYFSNALGVSRILQIASMVLAPYAIIGIEISMNFVVRVFNKMKYRQIPDNIITKCIMILLILFFIFNSKLPFEVTRNSELISMPLSLSHVVKEDGIIKLEKAIPIRASVLTDQEVAATTWFGKCREESKIVYATYFIIGVPALVSYGGVPPEDTYDLTPLTPASSLQNYYVYLGYINTVWGLGTTRTMLGIPDPELGPVWSWNISEIEPVLESGVKLYTNGGSEFYLFPEYLLK